MVDPYSNHKGRPLQPILSTTVLCEDEGAQEPFVGFFYQVENNNSEQNKNYLITARHNILPPDCEPPEQISVRFRPVSDPRMLLNHHKIDLYEDGSPVWLDHYSNEEPEPVKDPYVDAVAIPFDVDIPSYSENSYFGGEMPTKYLKNSEFMGEDAVMRERLYLSAFTHDHLPRGDLSYNDVVPFAGDEVSIISYQKTPDSQYPMPKIRHMVISTPYRIDYDEKPQFLADSRTFSGSSGAPVVSIPPAIMYSHNSEVRVQVSEPCLLGIHLGMEHRDLANEQLNLCRELRATELLRIFEHR